MSEGNPQHAVRFPAGGDALLLYYAYRWYARSIGGRSLRSVDSRRISCLRSAFVNTARAPGSTTALAPSHRPRAAPACAKAQRPSEADAIARVTPKDHGAQESATARVDFLLQSSTPLSPVRK